MITKAILDIFMIIPEIVIGLLPSIDVEIPEGVFNGLNSFMYGLGWLFPVAAIVPILVISLQLDLFRVVMAIVVRGKSFIPTLGD